MKVQFLQSACLFLISNRFKVTEGWKAYFQSREDGRTLTNPQDRRLIETYAVM